MSCARECCDHRWRNEPIMREPFREMKTRLVVLAVAEDGMSTVEYAVVMNCTR